MFGLPWFACVNHTADTTFDVVAADGVDPVRHDRTLNPQPDTWGYPLNSLWITVAGCDTDAMASNDRDIYERLGALELLVRHLYEKTGVPIPDLQTLASSDVSDRVRQLIASGNKIGAIKAYRDETNADLATATRLIESLFGG
jgi:hypothetical protein